jgi:hypothetical protein
MTPDEVVAWYRGLSDAERAMLVDAGLAGRQGLAVLVRIRDLAKRLAITEPSEERTRWD